MVTKSQRAGWNGQRLSLGHGTVDVNLLECKNPCKPSFGARFTLGNGVVNIRGKITIFNGKIHYKWPFSIADHKHPTILAHWAPVQGGAAAYIHCILSSI